MFTPIHVEESFESWLRRFAFQRNCEVGALLRHLDCHRFVNNPESVWLWSLGQRAISCLARFSRLPQAGLRSSEFSVVAADLFPTAATLRDLASQCWVSVGTLRFCPLCLAENPFFTQRWQLGFVVACERHGVLLTLGCGRCGRVRWSPLAHPPERDGGVNDVSRCPASVEDTVAIFPAATTFILEAVVDNQPHGYHELVEDLQDLAQTKAINTTSASNYEGAVISGPSELYELDRYYEKWVLEAHLHQPSDNDAHDIAQAA